jgi:hypothetical protein
MVFYLTVRMVKNPPAPNDFHSNVPGGGWVFEGELCRVGCCDRGGNSLNNGGTGPYGSV